MVQLTFDDFSRVESLKRRKFCRHCKYFVLDGFGRFHCFKHSRRCDIDACCKCDFFVRRENWLSIDHHFK